MTKKLISITLLVTMLLSILTGCSVSDLGYLKLSRELSELTEFSFESSIQSELSEEILDENYIIDFKLKGEANIADLNSMYMSFDMYIKVNDIGVEKPINFKILDNQLFVSKNILLELGHLEELINGSTGIKTVVQELYNKDLKDIEYILLSDFDVYDDINIQYMNSKDMYEKSFNYLTTAFKGFDTNLVKKTTNGYTVEFASEDILDFIESLMIYIGENRELVFDETVKFVEEIFNSLELYDITEAEKEETLAELRDSEQDFYDFVDEAIYSIALYKDEFDTYIDVVKGSKIKQQLSKDKNNFKDAQEMKLVYEDIKMLSLVSNTLITPKDIKKVAITGDVILMDELDILYDEVENRVNPVQEIFLEWWIDSNVAYTEYTRLEGNTYSSYQPFEIKDNRIFLPLREICESLGEEVEWDDVSKKAYIIRGEEKIDMTGIIKDSKTWIKVRDFEKLGYKIDYSPNGESSNVTITK